MDVFSSLDTGLSGGHQIFYFCLHTDEFQIRNIQQLLLRELLHKHNAYAMILVFLYI